MNAIPIMTDPLGKYWKQPLDIRSAPMDGTHVLLSMRQFKELLEYSESFPSGVYEGKCWRRQEPSTWFLCWYENKSEDRCAIKARKILIGRLRQ